jgi:ATP-binding cassette subfamily F protein uup
MDLEQQIADIDAKMNDISDFTEISNLSNKRSELEVLLEQKNERWIELLEIEEAIKNSR